MFTKPIDEITYQDVESFCQQWSEGVRVEYKIEVTVSRHIPKVVSSFANTYGGIFLIGVEADQKIIGSTLFRVSPSKTNRGTNSTERTYRYLSRSYARNKTCWCTEY